MVERYKRYVTHYMALALSNQYIENAGDIEANYILIPINNIFSKLYKYPVLLPQSHTYAEAIAMNLTFHW